MKTAEEYIPDSMPCAEIWRGIVRDIQKDALCHALETVLNYDCFKQSDGSDYCMYCDGTELTKTELIEKLTAAVESIKNPAAA